MCEQWGLLGSEAVTAPRRTRDLGLRASVRKFNDLAVPGLGNVWFCKQIFLALLGVAVAENARARGASVRNIEVTNSVEAFACWLGYQANNWEPERRLRGRIKLDGREAILFEEARERHFYVTQPMRMGTVQTLPALGLVEAGNSLFNSFRCTREGRDLLDAAVRRSPPRPERWEDHKKWAAGNPLVQALTTWVLQGGPPPDKKKFQTLLSPLEPLPEAVIPLLRHRLVTGSPAADAQRRRDALAWVATFRSENDFTWEHRPPQIKSPEHWRDLEAGACFFALRDAALAVLDAVEGRLGSLSVRALAPEEGAPALADELAALERMAERYLAMEHPEPDARRFAQECRGEPAGTVRALVKRDGQGVQLRGGRIVPGPAFRGIPGLPGGDDKDNEDAEDGPELALPLLPAHISVRIRNLLLLRKDLEGGLDAFLKQEDAE